MERPAPAPARCPALACLVRVVRCSSFVLACSVPSARLRPLSCAPAPSLVCAPPVRGRGAEITYRAGAFASLGARIAPAPLGACAPPLRFAPALFAAHSPAPAPPAASPSLVSFASCGARRSCLRAPFRPRACALSPALLLPLSPALRPFAVSGVLSRSLAPLVRFSLRFRSL